MLIKYLHRWLTSPIDKPFSPQGKFWFCLSLTFAAICGIQGLQEAFSSQYVIQDDARQHLFWMYRFLDPELFPNDLITEYYQSTAPLAYKTFYRLFAVVGIDPIVLSKLLPVVLGLITTGYGFALCMQILPVPTSGFIATLLLNYMLWSGATLVTATSRAFLWPFFIAFLYYLLRRSWLPCLIAIALQGLFYPPVILVTAGILILRLLRWQGGFPRFSLDLNNYRLCLAGLGIVFLVLLPQVFGSSEFGPIITVAEARALAEFGPEGRTSFFVNNTWDFWFNSHRSALMGWPWKPPILYTSLILPFLLRDPSRFPLTRYITSSITILLQMVLVSVGLFFAAHALLFKLYLPSRYALGLGIAIYLATGIALVLVLDAVLRVCEQPKKISLKDLSLFFTVYVLLLAIHWFIFYYPGHKKLFIVLLALGVGTAVILFLLDWVWLRTKQNNDLYLGSQGLALVSSAVFAVALLVYPSLAGRFPSNDYVVGTVPQLYEFFGKQPKDILIASLAPEADNLPSFAKRSILVGREYALPYEVGYYKQIRQRAIDLINAQYSPELEQVKSFIEKYGVDFWLLERNAFTPEYIANPGSWTSRWIRQYQPAATEALERLEEGTVPALAKVMPRCSVLETENFVVVDTDCIRKAYSK
ncbi:MULTISPECIES: hypothetical protein [unclassified Coleofasciculus]|uniref:hypothetical protein n=1 Tax=unclassified Coleofasciculus TaxID=2692782 RepID=UPI0018820F16|nr:MULTISPECIES: hypothetical protein [unclassified Coleofasciculus]MBE9125820.1 hypothetical protein [Coleofasciculus sp. LEGE 07081]MBE9148995.1 hypothetical protein [Coleofasciculus sp. LEGE 07092]